jgi:hypothetical protein
MSKAKMTFPPIPGDTPREQFMNLARHVIAAVPKRQQSKRRKRPRPTLIKTLPLFFLIALLTYPFAAFALDAKTRIQRGTDLHVHKCAIIAGTAYNIAVRRDEGADIGTVKFVIRQELMDSDTEAATLMMVDGIYEDDWRLSPEQIRSKLIRVCLDQAGIK